MLLYLTLLYLSYIIYLHVLCLSVISYLPVASIYSIYYILSTDPSIHLNINYRLFSVSCMQLHHGPGGISFHFYAHLMFEKKALKLFFRKVLKFSSSMPSYCQCCLYTMLFGVD